MQLYIKTDRDDLITKIEIDRVRSESAEEMLPAFIALIKKTDPIILSLMLYELASQHQETKTLYLNKGKYRGHLWELE